MVIEELREDAGLTISAAGKWSNIRLIAGRKSEYKFSWELPKFGAGH